MMTTTDCKECQAYLPELLLAGEAAPPGAAAHLQRCAACRQELRELQATVGLLDEWTAPEPSPFFDARVYAALRRAQATGPESWWERVSSYLRFSTGRGLRPAMAGALGLAMLLGGGTAVTLLTHHGQAPSASPTVNDLKIYDNNAQALDEMDLLEDSAAPAAQPPQS